MTPRLRTILLLLVALCLPLRGYAAATMMLCGPTHQGAPSSDVKRHAAGAVHHAGDANGHEAGAAHDHGAAAHSGSAGAQQGDDDSGDGPTTASLACGLCGSCCTAAALVGQIAPVGGVSPAAQAVRLPDSAMASFVANLLLPPPNRPAT